MISANKENVAQAIITFEGHQSTLHLTNEKTETLRVEAWPQATCCQQSSDTGFPSPSSSSKLILLCLASSYSLLVARYKSHMLIWKLGINIFNQEHVRGFLVDSDGKESACNAGELGSIPGSGKIPRGRAWQPTPIFLPGEFHGQRSLASYSPRDCKELNMTDTFMT